MSWDSLYQENNDSQNWKNPTYRSTGSAGKGNLYCILRVGKSYKTLGQITGFEKHMERLQDTPNADPSIKNEIVVGGKDLSKTVEEYISDARYMTNNTVIARELLLTASPDFFKGMPKPELDKWVDKNINWLQQKYGSMILYATLHMDESTPHLHVLLSPKVWSEARGCYVMSSRKLFGNKYKLRELQTEYANIMKQDFNLYRGIQNSRAKHIDIKRFYGIINNARTPENAQSIYKDDILLRSKLKSMESTLKAYQKALNERDSEVNELRKQLSKGKQRER